MTKLHIIMSSLCEASKETWTVVLLLRYNPYILLTQPNYTYTQLLLLSYPHAHSALLLARDEEDLRASFSQEAVVDWGFWGPGMALDGG